MDKKDRSLKVLQYGRNGFSRKRFLRSVGLIAASMLVNRSATGKVIRNVFVCSEKDVTAVAPAVGLSRYYAHDAVLDPYGVIAPWYQQLNGQMDFRIRVAAETMKRYPWTNTDHAVAAYPDYLFTSNWSIANDGTITPKHYGDWSNGDLGQRAFCVLQGMMDYYRYTADPAAIAHLTYMGDFILDYVQTPADHPWPQFLISVPMKGKAYQKADPAGMIQLDIAAHVGEKLLRASYITKNERWRKAAQHWGDLLAEHCDTQTDGPPWKRFANPETVPWQDHPRMNLQTGSVVMIMSFFDELMRSGYNGKNGNIPAARNAGMKYLQEKLLPEWTVDKTWGCYFWDWIHDMQESSVTAMVAIYMMDHRAEFPNWKNDVRNIITLFIHRASADPKSGGDVYNGAWAYPESSMCCQRSLFYAPLYIAPVMLRYAELTGDEQMREMGYRQMILHTYEAHDNGVSEDIIDGGINVNADWLAIAVPWPLQAVLCGLSWAPEYLGANRENHIIRSTATVDHVSYGKGRIAYSTFDAPPGTTDILRLAFRPVKITADNKPLERINAIESAGTNSWYHVKSLPNGDAIVTIRHDDLKNIVVSGTDPQRVLKNNAMKLSGEWVKQKHPGTFSAQIFVTEKPGAELSIEFTGNQLRLIGSVDKSGGRADIFLDGVKQLCPLDCWNPIARHQQVLYYRNGLENGKHLLKIVAKGESNPYAKGTKIYIDALQFSGASGSFHFPCGGGPTTPQRIIFGYTGRKDYVDSKGNLWRPATELVTPLHKRQDTVSNCWMPETSNVITNTPDPELYRYGCLSDDFWVNLTVGPGTYQACLHFAMTREETDYMTGMDILINEKIVVTNFNLPGTAKDYNKAVRLVFKDIIPLNGIICVRLRRNADNKELTTKAFIQALEVAQSLDLRGDTPVVYKKA